MTEDTSAKKAMKKRTTTPRRTRKPLLKLLKLCGLMKLLKNYVLKSWKKSKDWKHKTCLREFAKHEVDADRNDCHEGSLIGTCSYDNWSKDEKEIAGGMTSYYNKVAKYLIKWLNQLKIGHHQI